MSAITGGFDAVLEISGPALEKAGRAMHQSGNLSHRFVGIHNGNRFEFSVGALRLELDSTTHPDPWARCIARSRAICRVQPIDDPYGTVDSTVVDLALHGKFELPAGDPAPIDADSVVVIDWTETTTADITVHSNSTTLQSAIRAALIDMAVTNGGTNFTVGHLSAAGVTSIALVVVPGISSAPPALGLGLNMSGMAGARPNVPNLIKHDWAVAIDADLICGQVLSALGQMLGGNLPPPHGSSPILFNEEKVCVFQTPVGCVEAMQRMYLDSLTIEMTTAGIRFRGEVRQETDTFFSLPVSAFWDATVAIGVTPQGILSTTVGIPAVHLNQWYAQIANLLTAGRLETAVSAGVQSALDAGIGASDATGLLGVLVSQLATAGRTADAGLTPRPTSVEAGPDALIIHGVIDHGLPAPAPVAKLSALATPVPGQLLFNAGASWAPQDDVITYDWEFGDGTTESSTETNASFAAEHVYTPGAYNACVKVIDSQGRSAQQCISIQPGRLAIEHIPDGAVSQSAWQACVAGQNDLELIFEVRSCGSLLPGVMVTAHGSAAWSVTGVTDQRGRALLALNPSHAIPPPASSHFTFTNGSFTVEASMTGFDSANGVVELLDCNELGRIILDTKQQFADRIDRLIGYAALKDLIASGIGKQFIPSGNGPEPTPKPHLQSRITADEIDAIGIGIGTRVFSDLIQLLEINRNVFPVHELLGLDPHAKDFSKTLNRRLETVWRSLDATARRLEGLSGPDDPRDRKPRRDF
jgi:PKD domain